MVTAGSRLADVGTDHAYLPVSLVSSGKIPCALAMDINEGPLERARDHIASFGLEDKISTRRSDGLRELAPGEADSVSVCGMGGALTIRILEEGSGVLESIPELILQPQSEITDVRFYLKDKGYHIVSEDLVYEEGKFYPMMKAVHRDRSVSSTESGTLYRQDVYEWLNAAGYESELTELRLEACCRYGGLLLKEKHPVLTDYLKYERNLLLEIRSKLLNSDRTDKVSERLDEITHEISISDQAIRLLDH